MKDLPKPNLLERAIAAFAPQWALERHKARAMTALSGGYTGAGYHERMAYWMPGNGDADADITMDLRDLRSRSRDLIRNSPIAAGAIETQVSHVIGTGLTLQARIDHEALGMTAEQATAVQKQFEREFKLWCESTFCDAMGELNFYELQDLAFRTFLESGDGFTVLAGVSRPEWPYKLALQIIEADRVSNKDNRSDDDKMTQGIEKDARGAPIAVHIADRHPGTRKPSPGTKWTRVAIRGGSGRVNVIQLKRVTRPGQTRGVPALAPIIEKLKQLDRYSTAEVDAAVNSAAQAVFAKMDPEAFQELFSDEGQAAYIANAQRWDGTLRSGAVVNLLPGESIDSPSLGRPNPNFDPFVSAVMRQIGMGLNIPYEVLTKHFQSSYSAARAALLDAWRTFKIRREWMASKWCQPIYEEFLAEAIAAGRINAPGFFADPGVRKAWCGASWHGDGPGAIDPEKEANAAEKRMNIGLTTLAEEIVAYDGGDWEQKHPQQVRERQAREDGNLSAPVNPPMPDPGATPPGDSRKPARP